MIVMSRNPGEVIGGDGMRSYMRTAGCWSRVELRDSSMASRWLTTGDEVMINSRLMCCGDDRLEVS
jgi:hypothetical protein